MALPLNTLNIIRRTRNFDQVYDFYAHTLGLAVISLSNQRGNRSVLLSLGEQMANATVEILAMDALPQHDTAPIYIEFSISVDDATAWHDRLSAAGVTIARGLEDTPWGIRSFGIDDPDGVRISFQQYID